MGMVINTNLSSLAAQRHLENSRADMETSMERLASGKRINSAADDAAGLTISNLMSQEVAALNQASRNIADGISLIDMAEGAIEEISNMLIRYKELAMQGANETNGSDQLTAVNSEMTALKAEMDRIIAQTAFNGTALLSGNIDVDIHTGPAAADKYNIATTAYTLTVAGAANQAAAVTAITAAETDLQGVDAVRSALGAAKNMLVYTGKNTMTRMESTAAAASRIMDADFAQESANLAKNQVLQQAGTAMLAQANASTQNVLSLLK
jgi:flagellin